MKTNLVSNAKVSILDVGAGPEGTAKAFFPEAIILRLDGDPEVQPDYVHDIRDPLPADLQGRFDIVFASHVLEHIEPWRTVQTLRNLREGVKEGGEVWVLVPSLEWVGTELRKDNPSPAVMAVLYSGKEGNSWQQHRCGFTLMSLRQIVEKAGLIPRQAYQGPITVTMNGKDFPSLQNILVAMRHDGAKETE